MPRSTDFCSCIYVFGCKLSLVTLCDSDFGITPVDDLLLLLLLLLLFYVLYLKCISNMFRSIMGYLQGESHKVVYIKHGTRLKLTED